MKTYELKINGNIMKRGFWIYSYKIFDKNNNIFFYIGRTGDSSSLNASSPFNRMLNHFGNNRHSNSLKRNLVKHNIDINECSFVLNCFGPFFEEANNKEEHYLKRDYTSSIEIQVANLLNNNGYKVIGTHQMKDPIYNDDIKTKVNDIVSAITKDISN